MKVFYLLCFCVFIGFTYTNGQSNDECITFSIENGEGAVGDVVCLDVTVESFSNILGLQFSVNYNPSQLAFESVNTFGLNGLTDGSFGLPNSRSIEEGNITLVWVEPTLSPFSLQDSTTFFQLCFTVIDTITRFAPVYFSGAPTRIEFTDGFESTISHFNLKGGGVRISNDGNFPAPLDFSPDCLAGVCCDSSRIESYAPTVNSGNVPLAYQWRNDRGFASQEAILNNPDGGAYEFILTDASGQQLINWIQIGEAPFDVNLSLSADIKQIICEPYVLGQVSIFVNGGSGSFSYLWSTGSTDRTIRDLGPGIYSVVVIDDVTGQTAEARYIIEDTCPTFGADLSFQCDNTPNGNFTTWFVERISGGIAPYSYAWQQGNLSSTDSIFTIPSSNQGTISVVITDATGRQLVKTTGPVSCTQDCVSLFIENGASSEGDLVCLDITAESFNDILGMQFSINFDPDELVFSSVIPFELPGLNAANFGITDDLVSRGIITFSWIERSFRPASLPNGTKLFQVCFRVKQGVNSFAPVYFSNYPTSVEVLNGDNQEPYGLNLIGGGVRLRTPNTPSALTISPDCIIDGGCSLFAVEDYSPIVFNGVAPYSHEWIYDSTLVSQSETLRNPRSGMYAYTTRDDSGQELRSLIKIGYAPFNLLTSTTNISCTNSTGGEAAVDDIVGGSGNFEFLWSNGESVPKISNLSEGIYRLTVTDLLSGCIEVADFEIIDFCLDTIDAQIDYDCFYEDDQPFVRWNISRIYGGTPPYNISWQQGIITSTDSFFVVPADILFPTELVITDAADRHYFQQLGPVSCTDDCVNLFIDNEVASDAELVCLDITVESFNDILGMQLSINFNPDELTLDSIVPTGLLGLNAQIDFGATTGLLNNGIITLVWIADGLNPVSLPDGESLFQLCFRVKEGVNNFSAVYFSDNPVTVEITNSNFEQPFGINLIGGGVRIDNNDNEPPALTFTPDCVTGIGCRPSGLSYTPNIEGGTGPYTNEWLVGTTIVSRDISFKDITLGSYVSRLSDATGQQLISLIKIGNTGLLPVVERNDIFCDGNPFGSINIGRVNGGSGNYTYNWSTGATTASIDNLPAGTYGLTITDVESGCIFTDEYIITDFCLANFNVTINSECFSDIQGGMVKWEVGRVSGGVPPYQFTWYQGDLRGTGETFIAPVDTANLVVLEVTDKEGNTWTEIRQAFPCLQTNPTTFELSKVYAETGDFAAIAISGNNLAGIKQLEWTIDWNPTQLKYLQYSSINDLAINVAQIQVDDDPNRFKLQVTFREPIRENDQEEMLLLGFEMLEDNGLAHVSFDASATKVFFEDGLEVSPRLGNGFIGAKSPDDLVLQIEGAAFGPGDTACLAVSAINFSQIQALQYALEWDNDQLELLEIKDGVFPANAFTDYQTWNSSAGILRFAALRQENKTFFDSDIHYELCFLAKDSVGNTTIQLRNDILPAEAFNRQLQYMPVILRSGTISTGDSTVVNPTIQLSHQTGRVGERLMMPVVIQDFDYANEFNFTISWDFDIVELERVIPGTIGRAFFDEMNIENIGDGFLRFSWKGNRSIDLASREVLCYIEFLGIQEGATPLEIDSAAIKYNNGLTVLIETVLGSATILPDTSVGAVTIFMDEEIVSPSVPFCTPVKAANFTDILAMQYAHHWDPTVLRLDSIANLGLPRLQLSNFSLSQGPEQGFLNLSWISDDVVIGTSVPDGTVLYELCFTPIGTTEDSTAISFEGRGITPEFVGRGNQILPFRFGSAGIALSDDFVWPGDTDRDGTANHFDLLNIGIAYNRTGYIRDSIPSIVWNPMMAEDWPRQTRSGVNYKHIDTNGDAIINAEDTTAILQNWGLTTPWHIPSSEEPVEISLGNGQPLYVEPQDNVGTGKYAFNINLGTPEEPAKDVYGLAFTIKYDFAGIKGDDVYVDFSDSWIGQEGQDLLVLQRNDPKNRKIDIALTRIDGRNVSGMGAIAKLHVTIEDIILFSEDKQEELLHFIIQGVKLIDFEENEQEVNGIPTSVIVRGVSTSLDKILEDANLQLYPNPAHTFISVSADKIKINSIEIFSLQGRLIERLAFRREFPVNQLENGAYLIRFITKHGAINRRVVIQH